MNDPESRNPDERFGIEQHTAPGSGAAGGELERGEEPHPADTARRERLLHAVSTPLGSLCLVGGLVMIPLPGPSLPLFVLGLGLLAREYGWARSLLQAARRRLRIRGRKGTADEAPFEVPAGS